MWWHPVEATEPLSGSAQTILTQLQTRAGAARQRWGDGFLAAKNGVRRHQRLVDSELRGKPDAERFDSLAAAHDKAFDILTVSHSLLSDSKQALLALREASSAVAAARADRGEKRLLWLLDSRSERREGRDLTRLEEELLEPDRQRLITERDRLVSEMGLLVKQLILLRQLIRRLGGPQAEDWYRAAIQRVTASERNRSRATHGLPPLPLDQPARAPQPSRLSGVVKWYDSTRKIGLIAPLDGSGDVFVHRQSLHDAAYLQKGQKVGFVLRLAANRRWADQVIRLR